MHAGGKVGGFCAVKHDLAYVLLLNRICHNHNHTFIMMFVDEGGQYIQYTMNYIDSNIINAFGFSIICVLHKMQHQLNNYDDINIYTFENTVVQCKSESI